jgi:hypothetical protein
VVQHQEAWQNMGPILNSKHTINSFCLELAKKLHMRHKPPAQSCKEKRSGIDDASRELLFVMQI